jgi:hypothetical protein
MIQYSTLAIAKIRQYEQFWSRTYYDGVKAQIDYIGRAGALIGQALDPADPSARRTRYEYTWIFYDVVADDVMIQNLNDTRQERGGVPST